MMNARECVLTLEENISNNFELMPALREKVKRKLNRKRNYFLHG